LSQGKTLRPAVSVDDIAGAFFISQLWMPPKMPPPRAGCDRTAMDIDGRGELTTFRRKNELAKLAAVDGAEARA
jgi:hypothetical protein